MIFKNRLPVKKLNVLTNLVVFSLFISFYIIWGGKNLMIETFALQSLFSSAKLLYPVSSGRLKMDEFQIITTIRLLWFFTESIFTEVVTSLSCDSYQVATFRKKKD